MAIRGSKETESGTQGFVHIAGCPKSEQEGISQLMIRNSEFISIFEDAIKHVKKERGDLITIQTDN
jgi:hypothetical protein